MVYPDDRLERWKEHIMELFNDSTSYSANGDSPDILEQEVREAIKKSKKRLAPGPDVVPNEILKLLDDEGISTLTSIFNTIYNTGIIHEEWLKSTFITLPKKTIHQIVATIELLV